MFSIRNDRQVETLPRTNYNSIKRDTSNVHLMGFGVMYFSPNYASAGCNLWYFCSLTAVIIIIVLVELCVCSVPVWSRIMGYRNDNNNTYNNIKESISGLAGIRETLCIYPITTNSEITHTVGCNYLEIFLIKLNYFNSDNVFTIEISYIMCWLCGLQFITINLLVSYHYYYYWYNSLGSHDVSQMLPSSSRCGVSNIVNSVRSWSIWQAKGKQKLD